MSALNPTRNATRVQAPPGGYSSISFGGEPIISPRKALPAAPAQPVTEGEGVVAEPAETVSEVEQAAPVDEGPSLEVLKLHAIGAIAAAADAPDVRQAISTMLKQLRDASEAERAKAAAEGISEVAPDEVGANDEANQADAALAALKAALKLRGTHGIISVGKKFRSLDDDGDHKLAYDEFKKGLQEMKLQLPEADMMRLFRKFDRDASGFLSFDELLGGLRGHLSERRLDMVNRCFKVLDVTGDGKVTLADLERRYDASRHPDVVSGLKSQRMVLLEFLGVFEAAGSASQGDNQVDFDEFKTYYAMISSNIDEGPSGDDYFELMLRNVWHVSGGEGWCANTTCKRVLVVFDDDKQKIVELTDDFDVDVKDLTAVKAKLTEQGVTGIKSVALYGDMNTATTSPSPASDASPSFRPSTGRRSHTPEHVKSSIVFG